MGNLFQLSTEDLFKSLLYQYHWLANVSLDSGHLSTCVSYTFAGCKGIVFSFLLSFCNHNKPVYICSCSI